MPEHFFICYSSVDGELSAQRLADELSSGPMPVPVWLDKRELRPNQDWDEQIVEAIRNSKGMLFVMTADSVQPDSVCEAEWARALKYKKPLIPLLADADAELPFRLGSRKRIDITGPFDAALAGVRNHLAWIDTSEGQLQQLKYRMADAQRDLLLARPDQEARLKGDIAELQQQIARQQAVLDTPDAAREETRQAKPVELSRPPVSLKRIAKPAPTPPSALSKRDLVFVSYSHYRIDKGICDDFLKMIRPKAKKYGVQIWSDHEIPPGARWRDEVEKALARARVGVLLVSSDFLDSSFIQQDELPPLLEAAREGGCLIFWIACRPCNVDDTEIGKFQCANQPERPLTALTRVAREMEMKRISQLLFEPKLGKT